MTYTSGSSTQIGVGLSVNGAAYSISGTHSYNASSSWSTGIARGPKASYLNVLAMNYSKEKMTEHCPDGNTTVYRRIIDTGIHSEPGNSNWNPYTLGASVLYQDGKAAWAAGSYHAVLLRRATFCVSKSFGYNYGVGVSIFGIGLNAQTNHSTSTQQCISEGTSSSITHRVWGSNHYIYNGPKRFFSY
jgi:hypothetical protein